MPNEPSAFSLYNVLSGPFSEDAPRVPKRAPQDWETASAFADGYGATLPMDVGKQGRRKERERLGKARELQEAEIDQDSWFDRAHNSRARNDARGNRGPGRNGSGSGGGFKANGKIKFNFSGSSLGGGDGGGERGGKRQRAPHDDDLPELSRETDTLQIRGAARKHSYGSSSSSKDRHHDRHHDRHDRYAHDRSHNRYDAERESQRGPRYRGGYR